MTSRTEHTIRDKELGFLRTEYATGKHEPHLADYEEIVSSKEVILCQNYWKV